MKRFFEAANFSAAALLVEAADFSASALLRNIRAHTGFVTHPAARHFKLLATKGYGRENPGRIFPSQRLLWRVRPD
ncbi:MAG TPA: hypothetical protein VEN78_41900 [Bradyrhizobium sp.]|nr:hypothetical protein [Bradyrhizobium sp.]